MKALRLVFLSIVVGSMLYPVAASAQSGSIAGLAKDTTGALLPGVTVEAASPALIETVKSAVTDAEGQYRIEDLRPGSYTVTFTLAGFTSYKREGLELNIGVTLPVNGELRVGSVTETITVTGASPVVDVQNVRTQSVLTRQVLDTIPIPKNNQSLAQLTVGVYQTSGPASDVGGVKGETYAGLATHGGADGMTFMDGMRTTTATNFVTNSRYQNNQFSVQEVVLDTGGVSAESLSGGVNVNVVGKDGGNRFSGTFGAEYANQSMQSSNLTDALKARGLSNVSALRHVSDVGVGIGGPVMKDKLWFYTAHRKWGGLSESAGIYANKNQAALSPSVIAAGGFKPYVADTSNPGLNDNYARDNNFRFTWQATAKQRVAVFGGFQDYCLCPLSYAFAPEAAYGYRFHPNNLIQATWSYPVTSKLLIQAGYTNRNEHHIVEKINGTGDAVSIVDQTLGTYGAVWSNSTLQRGVYGDHGQQGQNSTRVSLAYVTGSHNFKAGVQTFSGQNNIGGENVANNQPYQYILRTGVPVGLNLAAYPHHHVAKVKLDLGIYAQDQWTVNRWTINGGIRYDALNGVNPAQCRPAGEFLPEFCFDEVKNVPNWKDISPRFGVAYDLFGNAKTAIKASVGRYVKPEATDIANRTNAASAIAAGTSRTWADSNSNFLPDCNLKDPTANGECGAYDNRLFGTKTATTAFAQDVREGWGVRQFNWQTAISVQHELRPGFGINVGYFNTRWGNGGSDAYPGGGGDWVTDNLSVTPGDFSTFCATAPVDSRLPGGGGYQVCDLYDVSPAKFGLVNNLVSNPKPYNRKNVYNGVDMSFNTRFGKGGLIYGGASLGRKTVDRCGTPDDPAQFCSYTVPNEALSQFKISGSYPIPYGLQLSATYLNSPGIPLSATYSLPNAGAAAGLGRNLAACGTAVTCTATKSIQLIAPFTVFEDRMTKFDIRLSKNVQAGRLKIQPRIDLYNVFNSNTVTSVNTTLGAAFLRPLSILDGRFAKVGVQLDF
ncbi:MAG: carboxypeptidase regulatory-like domain-containing protein [Vicinamibacterales bacterium]